MAKLWLIRHGKTEGNIQKLFYGKADLPLSQLGREEVTRRAASGCYPQIARRFTSGMTRTEQTYALIFGDAPHGVIPELCERNFGSFEMKTHEQLLESVPEYSVWLEDTSGTAVVPGGETNLEFEARVKRGLDKLLPLEEDTLVVCHGGVIAVAMSVHLFPGLKKGLWDWLPEPGCGVVIEFNGKTPVSYEVLPIEV